MTDQEKFETPFTKGEGCWLWTGPVRKRYGNFLHSGTSSSAANYSYRLYKGSIANGLQVRHKCDIPLCVNPEHLELGTALQNAEDREQRGRTAKGERQWKTQLTTEQVLEIRRKLAQGSMGKTLASEFNVSDAVISDIKHRHTWKHI